ncbi:homologous-pairing protein 2 homolog isoform X1 [Halichondria panicea]|uniref:homologous-pairing protein 2 homolog isoform X1 n=1 Tax=Halichondria panicea TaxID=6063 RepID=UPI00312BAB4B
MSKSKDNDALAKTKVVKYLIDTNRPYSTIDITANLHKEFGKTCVQRALDLLVVDGKVTEKVHGRQKVYFANQDNFPAVNEAELKEMDRRIAELHETVKKTSAECHKKENILSSLTSSLTSEDASKQLKALTAQISEMKSRLATIKAGTDSVTPEESLKIHKNHEQCFKQWRKRKRMANDMLEAILEGYPKSKKQLCEEVGIETDEESGVKLPGK